MEGSKFAAIGTVASIAHSARDGCPTIVLMNLTAPKPLTVNIAVCSCSKQRLQGRLSVVSTLMVFVATVVLQILAPMEEIVAEPAFFLCHSSDEHIYRESVCNEER